ncbi:uncharacterized protein LOC115280323 [Suricata suricatta]|uniref:uncharacterized protein LOC115280323 n=1 Tax=Suricata suricatta TaxID=37032 RepID=UPI0011553ACF|nr:uncharacterized protein LOC115280323 [Suricata suricatta]
MATHIFQSPEIHGFQSSAFEGFCLEKDPSAVPPAESLQARRPRAINIETKSKGAVPHCLRHSSFVERVDTGTSWMPSALFLARASSAMLKRGGKTGPPCVADNLRRKALSHLEEFGLHPVCEDTERTSSTNRGMAETTRSRREIQQLWLVAVCDFLLHSLRGPTHGMENPATVTPAVQVVLDMTMNSSPPEHSAASKLVTQYQL